MGVSRSSSVVQSGDADDVPRAGLEWRDMVLLCGDPSRATDLTQGLTQAGVPVAVVDYKTATPRQLEDLGAALTDQVILSNVVYAGGLERQVVVGFGGTRADRMACMSRCTGLLVWIGTPSDG